MAVTIAEIEQLPAGRELDMLVCQHVFKRECYTFTQPDGAISYRYKRLHGNDKRNDPRRVPNYSTDIENLPWHIIRELLEKHDIATQVIPHNWKDVSGLQMPNVVCERTDDEEIYSCQSDNLAVAVCKAALFAVLKLK